MIKLTARNVAMVTVMAIIGTIALRYLEDATGIRVPRG